MVCLQGGHFPEISEDIDSGTGLQTGLSEERAWEGHQENGEWLKYQENVVRHSLWCGRYNNCDCVSLANQVMSGVSGISAGREWISFFL